jgi:hypothetical protein
MKTQNGRSLTRFAQIEKDYCQEVYGSTAYLDKTKDITSKWTGGFSYSTNQTDIRNAWDKVIQGKVATSDLEKGIGDILATRRERWDQIASKYGIEAPKSFQVYRGVKGEDFVGSVVKAWKDDATQGMQIPHHTLSSWSMDTDIAKNFADETGVILQADIPFEMTLFDKWADGGKFVSGFGSEKEVVVATKAPNTLVLNKEQAVVSYGGKQYTYAERADLISAWDKAHPAS